MLLVDDDLRVIIYGNPAAHLMLAADSLVGRLLSEFSSSDRTSSDAWESAALDGRMHELERESELVSDVGHQLTASVRCDAMDLFGSRFFPLQLRDITEQRQLLIASELRFAQLAASLPDAAIFMFDHDLRLLLVLGEAMRANGYDPDAHLGALHRQRHPSTRCSTCTADEACVEPGTPDAHLGALHTQRHPSTRCSTCTADKACVEPGTPDAHLGALHTQRHPSTRCSTCTADKACVEPGTPDAHLGALHTQRHPSTRCSTCTADEACVEPRATANS